MPHPLYMDVQIPSSITEGLCRRGVDVITSQQDFTTALADEDLLSRAVSLGRVLFTQDADFERIASEWQTATRNFPGVVFAPQLGASIGRLIADLELLAHCAASDELANRVTHVPLK